MFLPLIKITFCPNYFFFILSYCKTLLSSSPSTCSDFGIFQILPKSSHFHKFRMPVISGRENYFCHTCKNSREITPEWKCAVCNSSFVERRESVSTPQPLPQQPVPPQPAPPRPVSQPITRPPSDFSIASIHQPSAGITDISQIHQAPLNFYNESSLRTSVPVRQVIRQPQRRPEQVPVRQQYYRRRTRLGPRVRQSRSFTRGRPSLLVDEDGNLIQSSNNDGFQLEEEESSSLFNIWQRINPGRSMGLKEL